MKRMYVSNKDLVNSLSDYIFWDVDKDSVDAINHAPFIVQRVLEYGQTNDWKTLVRFYGLERIVTISLQLRSLDSKALSFISTISNTPIENFRCYTTKQSIPQHLNF